MHRFERVRHADAMLSVQAQGRVAPSPDGAVSQVHHPRAVLHVVGRLTEAVFHFLGPVTQALRQDQRPQAVLLIDDPEGRRLAARLDPAVAVHFVEEGHNPLQRWAAIGRRLDHLVTHAQWDAIHLHGLIPVVLGVPIARRLERSGTAFFVSPHNSRSLQSLRWLGRPTLAALKCFAPLHRYRAIANVPHDVRAMGRVARIRAQLIESPVADVFFSAARMSDRPPPTVVGGAPADAVGACEVFSQLAVLLADDIPGLRFLWTSSVSEREAALLSAAGIERLDDPADPYARAKALTGAWIFVAPQAGRGFPMALAEAMAMGLPCVAVDTEPHRDMVTPGDTGMLDATTEGLGRAVAALLQDESTRRALGDRARREAMSRFSDITFRRSVSAAFSPRASW